MFTAAKHVTNLVWLIDNNHRQLDGATAEVLETFDLRAKFEAFGFDAVRIDGNDIGQVYDALTAETGGRPRCIILDTVKGKGVKEIEESPGNHSMDLPVETWERWQQGLIAELEALRKKGA